MLSSEISISDGEDFLSCTLTEEAYLSQRAAQSPGTARLTTSALSNARLFCKDQFKEEFDVIMKKMYENFKETRDKRVPLIFLQKYATWMSVPHLDLHMNPSALVKPAPCIAKSVDSIRGYVGQIRKYMDIVVGIDISSEHVQNKISYPAPAEREPPEPLTLEEFKRICDNQPRFQRRMLYRAMKSFESRIAATIQLKKKYFDTTVRPIAVTFPAHIMKKKNGKSYLNVKYVITEDEEEVLKLLEGLKDDDYVYTLSKNLENYKVLQMAINNEETSWERNVTKVGLGERYAHNNFLKKNIHSIKSLTFTAAEEAVSETYAHAYGDHSLYTKNYLRWSTDKKIKKFKMLEPHISMYSKILKVEGKDLKKRNDALEDKVEKMARQLEELSEEKKQPTKKEIDTETLERVKNFMAENGLLPTED